MRRIVVQVPRGRGDRVMGLARRAGGVNLHRHDGEGEEGPEDVVVAHVPNGRVEGFLADLEAFPDARITLTPRGDITLYPPADEAPEQATRVEHRSPVEVYLSGLQSVGTWRAFLGYAAAAGAVVWVGLLTDTVYLLVAAMLIAPYAGPAMNAALATARGDATLLRSSLARYAASLLVSAVVAGLLSLAVGQRMATQTMVDVANLSSHLVVLPLTAGAAGALHLAQSQRNSLVSGAAVGILVAASLAPPAGVLGMATVLGHWGMARAAAFVLLLQLVGIHLAGAVVFRLYGLSLRGARYRQGRASVSRAAFAAAVVLAVGLLAWQGWDAPGLQRASLAREASAQAQEVIRGTGLAHPVEVDARYPRADLPGGPVLLVRAVVQPTPAGANLTPEILVRTLAGEVRDALAEGYGATPLVEVVVLPAP